MKELSIEEKAKAYDEVREKIAIRFSSNVADEIFSQFEMSEDERIRKALIRMVKEDWPGRNDIIAWLEKQGEQKPAYTKEYDFHGMKFVPKFAKGDIIKDKKRSEVSIIKDFSYDTGLYTHTYGQFPITIQDNYEIIEQKPAEWHREDEQNLNACLGYIPDELLRRWLMDAIYAKYDKQMQVVTLIEDLKK